jgi:hypothetical protein
MYSPWVVKDWDWDNNQKVMVRTVIQAGNDGTLQEPLQKTEAVT